MPRNADRILHVPPTSSYQAAIYDVFTGMDPKDHQNRFAKWWFYNDKNGQNVPEYLMPQLQVDTDIEPFTFERRFIAEGMKPPSKQEIEALAPWAYQVEFDGVSTLNERKAEDWIYHRYRRSLLVETAARIAGNHKSKLSVLDVACHCGVFSLEFAEQGFGSIRATDLRPENIRQARFLSKTFNINNVSFAEGNARDIGKAEPADVVFCGGLLYHVTFPMELLKSLFAVTREFLVFDTLTHKQPFSGFYLVCNKDVGYSAEGEFHYEFHPTYRAVCDGLYAVGFKTIYEIVGSSAAEVEHYASGNVRSFVAVRNEGGLFADYVSRCKAVTA